MHHDVLPACYNIYPNGCGKKHYYCQEKIISRQKHTKGKERERDGPAAAGSQGRGSAGEGATTPVGAELSTFFFFFCLKTSHKHVFAVEATEFCLLMAPSHALPHPCLQSKPPSLSRYLFLFTICIPNLATRRL